MTLKRSTVAWLLASLVCGTLTLLVSTAPVGDPISAGLVYLAVWAMGIVTALCVMGLIYTALH